MIDENELRRLLTCDETDRVERTVSTTNTDKFAEAVTAFSNDLPGHRGLAASDWDAEYVLVDAGPNPGAITRAALIAADHVIVPVASNLFSLEGLRNLGPRLREWRAGRVAPLGYVITQHAIRGCTRLPAGL